GTWRLLDAGRSSCTRGSCPHEVESVVVAEAPPIAHTCGAASEPLEAPAPVEAPVDVEPAHTCGAGGQQLDVHDPFEPVAPVAAPAKHMMSDEEGLAVFEFVVEHLRMRDNATACVHLKHLIENTTATNKWHDKSANLFAHRCAPSPG